MVISSADAPASMKLPPGRRLARRVTPRIERATLPSSSAPVSAVGTAANSRRLAGGALGASTFAAGCATGPCFAARRRSRRRVLRLPLAGPAGVLFATLPPIPPIALALTTNTRCGSLPPDSGSLAGAASVDREENTLPSTPRPASTTGLPVLGSSIGARSPRPARPAKRSRPRPRAMLSTPLPILNALDAVLNARIAATTPAMPVTTAGKLSDSVVTPRATAVSPFAAISVAGRIASPMLRIASSAAWTVSAHCCAEVSRRSARFLSRMPEAFLESAFSSSYRPRFCP